MALMERPSGKVDLFIFDTCYRRPSEISQEFERHLKDLNAFSHIPNEDLEKTVNHAEGLHSLYRAGRVSGNPQMVTVDEAVCELEAGNEFMRDKLRGLIAPPEEPNIGKRLGSAARYVHLMESLTDNLRGTDPKNILNGRSKLYLPQFLRATRVLYDEITHGEKDTFGSNLETDAKIVAAAGAAVYQLGINQVIVLTRDARHVVEMVHRMKERIFSGGEGKRYGIMYMPQKDFSISAYSSSIPWLFEKGHAVKPELN